MPLSDETISKWAFDIANQAATLDGFKSYMISEAKTLFPGISAGLDAGQTVTQITDPYTQIAVRELGVARAIYLAHPTLSNEGGDFVRSDANAGSQRHRGVAGSYEAIAIVASERGAMSPTFFEAAEKIPSRRIADG